MPEGERPLSGCEISLTNEQAAQLKSDIGVDCTSLLVHRLTGPSAQDIVLVVGLCCW
jgi:hypothetical protein